MVSNSDHGNGADGEGKERPTITLIAPNGFRRPEPYHPNQKVSVVLADAVRDFGKEGQLDPKGHYILVKGATPLEPSLQLDVAGVVAGDELRVRSKATPIDGVCIRS